MSLVSARNEFTIPREFRFDRTSPHTQRIVQFLTLGMVVMIYPEPPKERGEGRERHTLVRALPLDTLSAPSEIIASFGLSEGGILMAHEAQALCGIGCLSPESLLLEKVLETGFEAYLVPSTNGEGGPETYRLLHLNPDIDV